MGLLTDHLLTSHEVIDTPQPRVLWAHQSYTTKGAGASKSQGPREFQALTGQVPPPASLLFSFCGHCALTGIAEGKDELPGNVNSAHFS